MPDYRITFWAHGVHHELAIDLECLARALKPYLAVQPTLERKECQCGCGHPICICGNPCNRPEKELYKPTPDAVEEKIKEIAGRWYVGDHIEDELRAIVKLAREDVKP